MDKQPIVKYLTPAELLVTGLNLPPLAHPPIPIPAGTCCCAITGQPIELGYPVSAMVTEATAEFLDCFRGGVHGYVSESAARCFKSANPRAGNPCARSVMAFEDGACWNPLISAESAAAQGRPAWRDLVRGIWPERRGQQCMMILTTDNKKRLWIRARVGTLGTRTPLLYYDGKTAGNEVLFLDWPRLLEYLEQVEATYAMGFPKEVIRESLYSASRVVETVGLVTTRGLERALQAMRGQPEFKVALLIAQRDLEGKEMKEEDSNDRQLDLYADIG